MAIIKSIREQLQEERSKSEAMRAELGAYKEMVEFLGVLNDVDIEDLMAEEEVQVDGEE